MKVISAIIVISLIANSEAFGNNFSKSDYAQIENQLPEDLSAEDLIEKLNSLPSSPSVEQMKAGLEHLQNAKICDDGVIEILNFIDRNTNVLAFRPSKLDIAIKPIFDDAAGKCEEEFQAMFEDSYGSVDEAAKRLVERALSDDYINSEKYRSGWEWKNKSSYKPDWKIVLKNFVDAENCKNQDVNLLQKNNVHDPCLKFVKDLAPIMNRAKVIMNARREAYDNNPYEFFAQRSHAVQDARIRNEICKYITWARENPKKLKIDLCA